MIAWLYMLTAIILEVSGTTCMKLSEGFTRLAPSVLMFVFYGLSLGTLTLLLKTKAVEISVVYAIWSGLGTALIAVVGFLFFRDELSTIKVISLVLIIVGVVGLNLAGVHGEGKKAPPPEVQEAEEESAVKSRTPLAASSLVAPLGQAKIGR